jgi:hypothetical protein
MLKGNPNVFHYTTFATADKLFSQHPIWQQAKIEAERKLIFEEYVTELKQRDVVCQFSLRYYTKLNLEYHRCSKKPGPCEPGVSPKSWRFSSNLTLT